MSGFSVGLRDFLESHLPLPPLPAFSLSIQHVFAMFEATILVPILTGLSPSTALFTAGTGTLIYIVITKARVPAFLGTTFAFIPAIIAISSSYGMAYAMGGAFVSGIFYTLVAFINI
jgi:uracil permease